MAAKKCQLERKRELELLPETKTKIFVFTTRRVLVPHLFICTKYFSEKEIKNLWLKVINQQQGELLQHSLYKWPALGA